MADATIHTVLDLLNLEQPRISPGDGPQTRGIAPVFTEIKERVQEVPAVPQVLSKQICRILPGDKSTFEAVGFGSSFLADKPIAGGKANN